MGLNRLNLQGKPLQILIIRNIRIDRPPDHPGRLVAKLHPPRLVVGRVSLPLLFGRHRRRFLMALHESQITITTIVSPGLPWEEKEDEDENEEEEEEEKGEKVRTYRIPRLQGPAMDGILVEALPLLEGGFGARVLGGRVPAQHGVGVVEPDGAAVGGQDAGRVVQEVVGVDDADLDLVVVVVVVVVVRVSVAQGRAVDGAVADDAVAVRTVRRAARHLRADLADLPQVIERAAQFVVAGFRGHEVVEARDAVERRDGAAVVRRDAGARVADQEGEVEPLEDGGRDDGRVVRLGGGDVFHAVGAVRLRVRAPVRLDGGGVGGGRGRGGEDGAALRADTFLRREERRGDRGRLAVGRDEVVGYILDEEAFALPSGK